VVSLPPMERACVLLKDIFDYSLEEIAELVDSTIGGVKAALNRGRGKLAALQDAPETSPAHKSNASAETLELLRHYIERFNRRRLSDSPYFVEYDRPIIAWRMALGEVDGELVVLILNEKDRATPFSLIRLRIAGERVVGIADYIKTPWVLAAAGSVALAAS
jgi:RNA polymerase sigma-70 factor (ECF subfamily)